MKTKRMKTKRWTRSRVKVPSTRRGTAPVAPAYLPAKKKTSITRRQNSG